MASASPYARAMRALVAGVQVNAALIVGGVAGNAIDGHCDTWPCGTAVGLALGAVASIAAFVRLRALLQDEARDGAKAAPVHRRRP